MRGWILAAVLALAPLPAVAGPFEVPDGLVLAPAASAPSGTLGEIYYDSTLGFRGYGASGWAALGGSVTSVGLSMPSLFTITGSPVTTSGTISVGLANASANTVLAGPVSGDAAAPTMRALVGTDLPFPASGSLGGVEALTATAHQFVTGLSTGGVLTTAQPSIDDISGAGPVASAGYPSAGIVTSTGSAFGTLVVGSGLTLTGGTLTADGYTLPAATGTTLGGISVPSAPSDAGNLLVSGGGALSAPIAGTAQLGVVKPDGTTITVTSGGVISSVSSGSGTVSSVGLALPSSIITVTGSPVTGTGTLTGTLASQAAQTVLAGPTSGSSAAPTFRSLVGADLPAPGPSTLGGVHSIATVAHEFVTGIATSGQPSLAQPSAADISGLYPAAGIVASSGSAFAPVTIGSGLSYNAGTLAATGYTLPEATTSVLGGIKPDGSTITTTSGVASVGTVPAASVLGLAASATTDTTDASNITSGTLPAARLPTSGVTAGTYGSATTVSQITVDATGRITSASDVAISGGSNAPIAAGRYYAQPSTVTSAGTNSVAVTATPLWVSSDHTIYSLSVSLGGTVNSGTLCLGIAPDDGSGAPGTLAEQACQAIGSANANSTVTLAITAYAAPEGLYWLEQSETATANGVVYSVPSGSSAYGFNGLQQYVGAKTVGGALSMDVLGYYSSDTPGSSLPSTLTGLTVDENSYRPLVIAVQY